MIPTLRPYQQIAVNDAINALSKSEKKAIIIEMPTGGGKTVVFSYIVSRAEKKGSRTLILTDRQELLTGTGSTLIDFGITPEYIRAGRRYPPNNGGKTFVAMAQTLKNRLSKPNWAKWLDTLDLIIIDEIHKQEFNKFFELEVFSGKTIIAVSATPKRGGKQRQLGLDFDEIVHTLTVVELIELEFLMPDMYFGFKDLAPDLKGVKKNSKGDYSESDMFKKYDNPKLYGGAVTAWKTHVPNTITLFFCSNIIHAVRTCIKFCEAGIPSKFVVSSMGKPKPPEGDEPGDRKEAPPEWIKYWERLDYYREYNAAMLEYSGERTDIINRWKSGEFKVLFNASILTTGFDFPAIETIGLLRATVSEVLYLQMLGRGSRPFEGKTHFNILDFGGNAERLGGYKLPRKWHLYHENKTGNGNPPIKECGEPGKDKNGKDGCGDYILASAKICPSCGYVYPEKKEEKEVDLQLMYTDEKGKLRAIKPLSKMNFEEIEKFREANKYKQFWLIIQLFLRGGEDEIKKYAKFKGYSPGWVTIALTKIPEPIKAEQEVLKTELS
jgi:superfamily II DNA or RNA helicase